MTISVDIWQLLGVASALLGMMVSLIVTAGKALIGQFEKRLDEKFSTMEAGSIAAQKHWDSQFTALEQAAVDEAKGWQRVERDIMQMKIELAENYVRKEDHFRIQSVLEAKIDGLAVRIENALLKGAHHG